MSEIQDAAAIAAQGMPPAGGDPTSKAYTQNQNPNAGMPPGGLPPNPAPAAAPVYVPPVNTDPNAALTVTPPTPDPTQAMLQSLVEQVGTLTQANAANVQTQARQGIFNAVSGTSAGTQDDFNKFTHWANNGGMDANQKAALDHVLATGDPATQAAMVAGYAGIYRATQTQNESGLVMGNTNMTPANNAAVGYVSEADFKATMRTEKYKTDPGFAQSQDTLRRASIQQEEKFQRGY